MVVNSISDHSLLRWMQREHGVDVDAWRRLMRDDVNASIAAYKRTMRRAVVGPAYLLSNDGSEVVTYFAEGWTVDRLRSGVAIPAVGAAQKQAAEA